VFTQVALSIVVEEFAQIFHMNIEEFGALPAWKQQQLKKAAQLF
jgi:hypothetical protein